MGTVDLGLDFVELLGYLNGWVDLIFMALFVNVSYELDKAHDWIDNCRKVSYWGGDYDPKKRGVVCVKKSNAIILLGLVCGVTEYLFAINTVG